MRSAHDEHATPCEHGPMLAMYTWPTTWQDSTPEYEGDPMRAAAHGIRGGLGITIVMVGITVDRNVPSCPIRGTTAMKLDIQTGQWEYEVADYRAADMESADTDPDARAAAPVGILCWRTQHRGNPVAWIIGGGVRASVTTKPRDRRQHPTLRRSATRHSPRPETARRAPRHRARQCGARETWRPAPASAGRALSPASAR